MIKLLHLRVLFQFLTMFNTFVGARAASRYGSGSDQMMRLLAAPAPQHWCAVNTKLPAPLLILWPAWALKR
jgi:hypothetical protein